MTDQPFRPGDVVRVLMTHPEADRVGVVIRANGRAALVAFDPDEDLTVLLHDEIEYEPED